MTPQEIDRIENVIRHIESSLDVDPWASENEFLRACAESEDEDVSVKS